MAYIYYGGMVPVRVYIPTEAEREEMAERRYFDRLAREAEAAEAREVEDEARAEHAARGF